MTTATIAGLVDHTIGQLAPLVRASADLHPDQAIAFMVSSLHRQIVENLSYPGSPMPPEETAASYLEAYMVLFTGRRPDGSPPFQIPAA